MSQDRLTRILCALAFLCCGAASARAQMSSTGAAQTPGSIAGRVTMDERGVAAVAVMLMSSEDVSRWKPLARAATDAEGRYKLSGIAPGRYQVLPVAPAFAFENLGPSWPPGRPVTLAPGESIEDVNFTLARGGVITGKVLEAEGKPVVGAHVRIEALDAGANAHLPEMYPMNETDDRGVYRLYGLPAGRYYVSVGEERGSGMVRMGGPGRFYSQTFHPDATEKLRAKVVEVAAGGEATDIDITLANPARTYTVTGRIIHAGTNQPAANVRLGYGVLWKDSNYMGGYGSTGTLTDAGGRFEIKTLLPGQRYGVFAVSEKETDWYSDVATFEIEDADVSGIEIKLQRGAVLSGAVIIEGLSDRAALARLLPSIGLHIGHDGRGELEAPRFRMISVRADGSFRAAGLRPGKIRLQLAGYPPVKGLSLVRVELEGVEQPEGIELSANAPLSGVRVVLAYGTGVVRGQVVVKNGEQTAAALPDGTPLFVATRTPGTQQQMRRRPVQVDARGRFLIEGLPAGETEVLLYVGAVHGTPHAAQIVSVPDGGEASVMLTLDLARGDKPDDR